MDNPQKKRGLSNLLEILLLIGNDTEDYFLLKKQPRRPAGKEKL